LYNDFNGNNQNRMVLEEQAGALEARSALYMAKVMGWMCVGLLTTVVSAMLCLAVEQISLMVSYGFITIIVAQLICVMILSLAIGKMSPAMATVMFMLYSALTGLTMSVFVLIYDLSTIALAFGIAAGIFLTMSVYGFVTQKDLSSYRRLLLFALIGLILSGIVNMLLRNAFFDFLICCAGVLIFIGLTAYDTQKIKAIYQTAIVSGSDEESDEIRKLAIIGALMLYLDFINIFLYILRLLGRRR